MTPILRFEDINSTFVFEIKTNLINATDDNFTICEVVGMKDAYKTLGVDPKQLPSTISAMKTLAYNHGLKLTLYKSDGTSTVLSELNANVSKYYGSLGLGEDNI